MKIIAAIQLIHDTIVPIELSEFFGRIAVHHSHLDMEINRAIWAFMGVTEPVGHAVTQTIRNTSDRLGLFLILAKMTRPSEEERFKALVSAMETANSDRNLLITSVYIQWFA